MGSTKITEWGSLELLHYVGDAENPETYIVRLVDTPRVSGSLEVARDFFEIDGVRLNGSQVGIVKAWADEYL